MSQVLRERAIGMLTAGMSTRAVELNVHFSIISRLQRHFREFGSTSKQSATIMLQNMLQQSVCIIKEFLHKLLEAVSGKLICMLIFLIRVSTWLQFVIVTDLSWIMLTFDGVWHFGEVFSSRMNPGFHCIGQMVDSVYGIMWVSGLLMSTFWIERPMVVVGLWYGQAYVMDNEHRCILLMAFWMHRYHDEILRPIVVPFIPTTITSCCSMIMHGLMLQVSVHNSWKLKTSQFLYGQHTHRTCHSLSMFGMLWIGVYDSVFQFLPISSNFTQPLKRSGATFHRPQTTTWSTLCEGDVLHCVRQMVVTPDTDWFSDPPPHQYSKTAHFIVASLRHTCAIIMLPNQHLDMPHLWGGWIISAKKCSLTQI